MRSRTIHSMVTTRKSCLRGVNFAIWIDGMRELRKTVVRMEPSQKQNGEDGPNLPPARPRRRWERHDITIPVTVTTMVNGERSSFSGQACDMSIGGLRLFLTREIEPGASLQVLASVRFDRLPFGSYPYCVVFCGFGLAVWITDCN